ncbi:hypothetical protein GCM10009798_43040 [Nocardioides panacihumi]|uniref:YggT family protein n=1 Tax=Nocardioides panacihumi TaxID=400774 RepID=A0ABP5DBP6_9ACTN
MTVPSAVPPRPPQAQAQPQSATHRPRRILLLGARVLVWLVYAYVIVTEVVLVLGFLLLLFGANPDASFVAWAYRSLDRAMEPFRGMFTPIHLNLSASAEVGAVLDTSVLFAMVVYAFLGLAVHALLEWLSELIRREDRSSRQHAAAPTPPAYGPPAYGPPTVPPPGAPPRS